MIKDNSTLKFNKVNRQTEWKNNHTKMYFQKYLVLQYVNEQSTIKTITIC